MASHGMAAQAPAAMAWDNTEPHCDAGSVYSIHLKADLLPGTFVLLGCQAHGDGAHDDTVSTNSEMVVARIISFSTAESSSAVTVNIFKRLNEVLMRQEGILHPPVLQDNHLRHLQEIVQTTELRVVSASDIMNLCFVFTSSSLFGGDTSSTLASTCQGMALAFLLRFHLSDSHAGGLVLSEVPPKCCLPFPSSYQVCTSNAFYSCVSLSVLTAFTICPHCCTRTADTMIAFHVVFGAALYLSSC
jgi:hypothetical protein